MVGVTSYLPDKVSASCTKLIRKLKLLEPGRNWGPLFSRNALNGRVAATNLFKWFENHTTTKSSNHGCVGLFSVAEIFFGRFVPTPTPIPQ